MPPTMAAATTSGSTTAPVATGSTGGSGPLFTTGVMGTSTSATGQGSESGTMDLPAEPDPDPCAGYDNVHPEHALLTTDAEVAELEGIECIVGRLAVSDGVTSLEPLHALRAIGQSFSVSGGIADFFGLENLRRIEWGISIGDVAPDAGCFSAYNLEELELPSLEHAGRLSICGAPNLLSLEGISSGFAGEVVAVGVFGTPALTSLAGLESVTAVTEELYLHGGTSVADLSALANLERVGGRFDLVEMHALTNLGGLGSLSDVGYLVIAENDALNTMAGLDALETIAENLSIRKNPMLPQTEVETWAAAVDVQGSVQICENLDGPDCY